MSKALRHQTHYMYMYRITQALQEGLELCSCTSIMQNVAAVSQDQSITTKQASLAVVILYGRAISERAQPSRFTGEWSPESDAEDFG